VLGDPAARADAGNAREGAAGRDGSAQARAGDRRGADAGQEPDRGHLCLPGRLDPQSRDATGPLRADPRLPPAPRLPRSPPPVPAADMAAVPKRYFEDEKKNVGILLPKP